MVQKFDTCIVGIYTDVQRVTLGGNKTVHYCARHIALACIALEHNATLLVVPIAIEIEVANEAALEVAKKLDKLEITVSANTVDGKRLYGSVGISDILAAIEANRGIKLERSQIELEDSLKEIGEYEPTIDLGHGVNVRFKITILDEGAAEV